MKIFKTNLSCKFFFPQAEIKVCYLVEMQKSCCSYSVCEDFIVPVLNLSSSMYLCVCVYKICTFSVGNWTNPLILHMCPHFIWIYMLTYMKIQYIYYRVFEKKFVFFLHKIKILFLPFVIACCQHKTFEQLTGHSIPSGSKCGDNFHPETLQPLWLAF